MGNKQKMNYKFKKLAMQQLLKRVSKSIKFVLSFNLNVVSGTNSYIEIIRDTQTVPCSIMSS